MPVSRKKKDSNFGSTDYESCSPQGAIASALQIRMSFEDALKLNLFLQQALHSLNRLNRSVAQNQKARVKLVVYQKNRIMVTTDA
jgi:hypothetical protein